MRCPRVRFDVVAVSVSDGGKPIIRYPASCDVWTCPYCGPRKASQLTRVLAWARPERVLTLTLAPHDFLSCRKKVGKLGLSLRKMGYRFEAAWVREPNDRQMQHHIHAVQHGDFVPQKVLQDRWGARVDIRSIEEPERAIRYLLKGALGGAGDLMAHLEENGRRAVHLTQDYLRGESQESVRRALRRTSTDPATRWGLVQQGGYVGSPPSGRMSESDRK